MKRPRPRTDAALLYNHYRMDLTFCGAAGQVTGSNYLLVSGRHKVLVDCGLFQGSTIAEDENFKPFPYEPSEIEAVFVTHAHLDHVGRLPKLYKEGFRGKVYSTPATRDCAELILLDSEKLLCQAATRHGHDEFCTEGTVEHLMKLWHPVEYGKELQHNDFFATFIDAGHILGSSSVVLHVEGKTIVFSGDIGNWPAPIIMPTQLPPSADYAVMESTYGNETHQPLETRKDALYEVMEETIKRGGVLMIPAFALERTQELLYFMNELFAEGKLPRIPVFLDSPLAIKLTSVYHKYRRYFNDAARGAIADGDDIFNFPGLHLTLTSELSKAIKEVPAPKVIIAGSGMSHGGRINHHELLYLSDPNSTLLIIGYQAVGSLGRKILDGAPKVKIFDEEVEVKCQVRNITSYSAHADMPKLLAWAAPLKAKHIFLVHGEEDRATHLAGLLKEQQGAEVSIAEQGQTVRL